MLIRFTRAVPIVCSLFAAAAAQAQTGNGEWPAYGGDLGHTRYAPLEQINASNFGSLEIAWRFSVANMGPTPEARLQSTPLVVDGVLYTTGGTRRAVTALDAATGEQLWVYSLNEGARGAEAPRQGLGTRARILAARRRQARRVRDAGLPTRCVECGDGPTRSRASARTASSISRRRSIRATIGIEADRHELAADDRGRRHHGAGRAHAARAAESGEERRRLHPRLRRRHGQAAVDVPHGAAARRARLRDVVERLGRDGRRQRRRLGHDLGRRRARARVPARRIAVRRHVRRLAARREPLRRERRRRRDPHRQIPLAFSNVAPSALGLRPADGADLGRRREGRPHRSKRSRKRRSRASCSC